MIWQLLALEGIPQLISGIVCSAWVRGASTKYPNVAILRNCYQLSEILKINLYIISCLLDKFKFYLYNIKQIGTGLQCMLWSNPPSG